MPEPTTWPIASVAARLGVSVPTLHSWDRRYGLAPSARTPGGHRRYSLDDIAKLQRLVRLIHAGTPAGSAAQLINAVPAANPPTSDASSAVDQLQHAVDTLDPVGMHRVVRLLLTELGTQRAWTTVLTPLLQDVGTRWRSSPTGIPCEHLLSDVIQHALQEHGQELLDQARHRTDHRADVLLAATSSERHTLALYAVAAGLAEHGLRGYILGRLPANTLLSAAEELRPRAVLLWARSTAAADLDGLRALRRLTPLTCAAGLGWPQRPPRGVVALRDYSTALELLSSEVAHADATGDQSVRAGAPNTRL